MSTVSVTAPRSLWDGVEADTEALLDSWLVREGQSVSVGQPLANIVLVKASHQVVAPVAGVLEKILILPEQTFRQERAIATLAAEK